MELTVEEMGLIVRALGTLEAEYGSASAAALAERVREAIERRMEEIRQSRY